MSPEQIKTIEDPQMIEEKFAYTVDEAARALSISRATLYKGVRTGQIKTVKFLGRTLVSADELRRVAAGETSQAAA